MSLGILTENGIVMNSSPILFEEKDSLFLGLLKRTHRNDKISSLIELFKKIKKMDT